MPAPFRSIMISGFVLAFVFHLDPSRASEKTPAFHVKEPVTFFIPTISPTFVPDDLAYGLYVVLNPDGHFRSLEHAEGGAPMECLGVYDLSQKRLALAVKECDLFADAKGKKIDVKRLRKKSTEGTQVIETRQTTNVDLQRFFSSANADAKIKIQVSMKIGSETIASRPGKLSVSAGNLFDDLDKPRPRDQSGHKVGRDNKSIIQ